MKCLNKLLKEYEESLTPDQWGIKKAMKSVKNMPREFTDPIPGSHNHKPYSPINIFLFIRLFN